MKLSYLVVVAAPLILGTVTGCQKQDTKQQADRRMNEYMDNGRQEMKGRMENGQMMNNGQMNNGMNGQQDQQEMMRGNQQNTNPYMRQYQQMPMQRPVR